MIILFPVCVFFVINNKHDFEVEARNVDSQFEFLIPKEHDLNVLFVDCNNCNGRNIAEVFVLFKISAHDNLISLISIPTNLKIAFNGRVLNLNDCFTKYDIDYVKKAFENFFDISIDRTIQADDTAVKGAINCLGGIKIDKNEKLNFNYDFPVVGDKKIIGGDSFCEILKQNPAEAFKLLKFEFFNKYNLKRFYAYFSNMFKSNISIYDFEIRQRGFEKLIIKKNAILLEPNLSLKFLRGHHIMSDFSKESCIEAFKK